MGLFDRFRRKGGKAKEEPAAPTPAPTPAPAPQAPAGEKKRGLLGRLADKVRGKEKPPAPEKEEAPPAAPPGPPGPPAPPGPSEGEGPEGEGAEEEAPPAKDYSSAPSSLSVRIPGTWQMSRKRWPGVVKGTLGSQAQVIEFLKALDEGREKAAVEMICEIFDDGSGFAGAVNLDESDWQPPVW